MENDKLLFANDLGYGAVKADLNGETVKFPSVIAVQREQDIQPPVEFDSKQQKDEYMKDLLNRLDVTISSSSVQMQGRFLVGNSAIESRLPTRSFDINDRAGKAKSDLSMIMTLSMIAGKRAQDAYFNGEDLGNTLNVDVTMATALPVVESKQIGTKDAYKERFLKSKHIVAIQNFNDPVTVAINFKNVYVAVEGETAQMFISYTKDQDFLKKLNEDYNKNYPDMVKSKPLSEVLKSKNIISIDIGAGTTDIIPIINGKANAHASNSLPFGYGSVLEDAIDVLGEQGYPFTNRAQLEEFLADKNPMNEGRYKRIAAIIEEQFATLEDRIVASVSRTLRKTGADIQAAFVSGGGSIPMKNSALRKKVVQKINSYTGGFEDVPVIWVPQEYAQYMNLYGLKMIVKMLDKK